MAEKIVLQFNSHTLRDAYYLQINSLLQAVTVAVVKADAATVEKMRIEVLECLAVIGNAQFRLKYPHLTLANTDSDKEKVPVKKDKRTYWTFGVDGQKVEVEMEE